MTSLNTFADSLNARIAFERAKTDSQMSDANYKKLEKASRVVSVEAIASLLIASNVNADFANRSVVANKRMNVYTIEKLQNVLSFIAHTAALNDYTFHIVKTAINCANAETHMTRIDAKDACSKHRKIADKSRVKLVSQNKETKDDSTVNAQHASSLDALLTLNVLRVVQDDANVDCFALNADNEMTKALIARFAA